MFLRRWFAVAGLSLLLGSPGAFAQTWEQIYVDDGVTVSRAEMEGTNLVGFKGDTVMDAPIEKVLYVLLDNDHRIEWVGRLVHNEVLQQDSAYDYVIYQVFNLPPPFSDRDYVYHGEVTRDPATGVVTLEMQSTEHPEAPETVGVRARLINSRYRLTPVDAAHTRVEVEILTDPMGMMPVWLVNLIQKSWPLDTLVGIRGQLDQAYTGLHPLPGVKSGPVLAAKPAAPSAAPLEDTAAPGVAGTEDTASPPAR